jgi:hypothetical protein
MSKHVDLIAIGALLVAFAFTARLHELAAIGVAQTRAFRVRPIHPVVVVPPRVPAAPRLPHLPRLHY